MYQKKLRLTGAALAMLFIILDSRMATEAAAKGLDACIRTVIPALFPFFLISSCLTGNLCGGRFFAKLFRSPENCGTLILTGLLGGYPTGAKLAAEQYRTGFISKVQGDRLLWFCSQAGPSFFFGIVSSQMENRHSAWVLWGIQLLSALSVAWLLPGDTGHARISATSTSVGKTEIMVTSLKAIAVVCGWIIAFSVILCFMERWLLWLLPQEVQILLCGLLELTSGCMMLHQISDPELRFFIAAIMLNFGGLCVMMQTCSVVQCLDHRGYLWGKCLQTTFSMLYALAWLGHIWLLIPVFSVLFARFPVHARKKSSIPDKLGV